jgi:serine/threonine protein phosphatase PrpC
MRKSNLDSRFSGCTLISVFLSFNKIYCINIGDSRAIVGRTMELSNSNSANNSIRQSADKIRDTPRASWLAKALSRDHKPDIAGEFDRINIYGGRVECCKDIKGTPVGPKRVWLADAPYPGLAMSRSIGDGVAKSVGVISEPGK